MTELAEYQLRTVEHAKGQACGYVWGRRDMGDEDATDSRRFAAAYAACQTRYFTDGLRTVPDVESAYLEWRKTGEITTGM